MRKSVLFAMVLALGAADARAAGTTCRLSYGNGALIPNVSVVALYWGTTNNGQYAYKDKLHQYYDAVTNSAYFDWLVEYDVTNYTVGRGSFAAEYADPSPPAGTTVDETKTLQPWISGLIDSGKVPPPDGNTLYFIHLPGTVQISSGAGGTTCSDNCAYHFFYSHNGKEVRYAVIPDQNSGACSTNQACPIQLAALDRLTIVASHELVEAVTDPNGAGWIDNNQQCGEIGDICVGQPGTAAGFTVQLEWSNKEGKCIDHDPNVVFNDFGLTLNPTMTTAPAGGSATASVQAMPTTGAQPQTVALTVDALPAGVTGTFASPSIQSNAATMLTLTVAPSMAPGSYTFNVTGKAGNGAHHVIGGMLTVTASSGGGEGGGAGNGTGGGSGNGSGGSGSGTGTGGNGNGDNGSGAGARGGGCSMGGVGARASDGPPGDGPLARFVFALAALALMPKLLRAATRRRRVA
ncbi:MAG TPA: hypothetical protein VN947_11440 [Polyangia bacterium]|nr:hypothetical protein [Polyangia bacterium]